MEIEEVDNLMFRMLGSIKVQDGESDIEVIQGLENNSKKYPKIVFDKMEIGSNRITYELFLYAKTEEDINQILNQIVKIRDDKIPGYEDLKILGNYNHVNWSIKKLEKQNICWYGLVELSNLDFNGWRTNMLKEKMKELQHK